jgi:hypothetical protein
MANKIGDEKYSTVMKSRSCWVSWIMGRDDGAEWVRYTDFFANPRVFLLTVELLLPTHMRCQSLADRTPLLAQKETLLDLTALHLL